MRDRRDAFVIFFWALRDAHQLLLLAVVRRRRVMSRCWGWLTALVHAHMPAGRPRCWKRRRSRAIGAARRADHGDAVRAVPAPRAAVGHPERRAVGAQRAVVGNARRPIAAWRSTRAIAFRVKFDGAPPQQSDCISAGLCSPPSTAANWRLCRRAAACRSATSWARLLGWRAGEPGALRPDAGAETTALAAGAGRPPCGHPRHRPREPDASELQWITPRRSPTCCAIGRKATRSSATAGLAQQSAIGVRRLPPGFNPRTQQLAADILRQFPTIAARRSTPHRHVAHRRLHLHAGAGCLRQAHRRRILVRHASRASAKHIASAYVLLMRAR